MTKLILSLLAILPFSGISFLASAKIQEISGSKIESAKQALNPKNKKVTTFSEIKNELRKSNGSLTERELDNLFNEHLNLLKKNDKIVISDRGGSGSVSFH